VKHLHGVKSKTSLSYVSWFPLSSPLLLKEDESSLVEPSKASDGTLTQKDSISEVIGFPILDHVNIQCILAGTLNSSS
jgi:hypothetical protein